MLVSELSPSKHKDHLLEDRSFDGLAERHLLPVRLQPLDKKERALHFLELLTHTRPIQTIPPLFQACQQLLAGCASALSGRVALIPYEHETARENKKGREKLPDGGTQTFASWLYNLIKR